MHASLIKISSSQKIGEKTKQSSSLLYLINIHTPPVQLPNVEIEKDCNSRYKPEIFPTSLQHPWPPSQ